MAPQARAELRRPASSTPPAWTGDCGRDVGGVARERAPLHELTFEFESRADNTAAAKAHVFAERGGRSPASRRSLGREIKPGEIVDTGRVMIDPLDRLQQGAVEQPP